MSTRLLDEIRDNLHGIKLLQSALLGNITHVERTQEQTLAKRDARISQLEQYIKQLENRPPWELDQVIINWGLWEEVCKIVSHVYQDDGKCIVRIAPPTARPPGNGFYPHNNIYLRKFRLGEWVAPKVDIPEVVMPATVIGYFSTADVPLGYVVEPVHVIGATYIYAEDNLRPYYPTTKELEDWKKSQVNRSIK